MTKRFGFTLAGATHVDMQQNTVKNAFTLAEVLITLGIIGVVAAMTMPTLMNSTQGAQYKAAYKKALSALSQAVTLNVALDEWSFADADNSTYVLKNMFESRMNVVRAETTATATNIVDSKGKQYKVSVSDVGSGSGVDADFNIASDNTTLFFNDGIMFSYNPDDSQNCTKADGATAKICTGFIDVNGVKAPNGIVQCDSTGADSDPTKCEIKNPTDVYPVKFYDQTVLPNSIAARAVLYSK